MFVIVQNDPDCPAGTCSAVLSSLGQNYRILPGYGADPFPDPAALTGVIVLGGEMSVYQTDRFPYLDEVRRFMQGALRAGTPLFGICLGGQLLAQVLGAPVASPSPHGEKGICQVQLTPDGEKDPLFHGVPSPFVTFQLHNDSFAVPEGALLLAQSELCPAQAFRLGEHAYGVQFHPEVDSSIVSAWGSLFTPPIDFSSGFAGSEQPFRAASQRIISNFVTLAAARRRP